MDQELQGLKLAFRFEILQANHSWHLGALSAFLGQDAGIGVAPEIDWLSAWSTGECVLPSHAPAVTLCFSEILIDPSLFYLAL